VLQGSRPSLCPWSKHRLQRRQNASEKKSPQVQGKTRPKTTTARRDGPRPDACDQTQDSEWTPRTLHALTDEATTTALAHPVGTPLRTEPLRLARRREPDHRAVGRRAPPVPLQPLARLHRLQQLQAATKDRIGRDQVPVDGLLHPRCHAWKPTCADGVKIAGADRAWTAVTGYGVLRRFEGIPTPLRSVEVIPSQFRVPTIVLAVVALMAAVAGVAIDVSGFVANFLAEVAGIAIGVVIALTLVERLLERRRTEQWERVRDQTLRAVHAHVGDMALDVLMSSRVSDHMPHGRDTELMQLVDEEPSKPGTADALELIADYMGRNTEGLAETQDLTEASTRTLYDEVKPEITQIRDVLTPRILQFGEDPELVELLVEIEAAERSWIGALSLIEGDWGLPEGDAWTDASKTFGAAARVARHISRTYKAP
jgi:hypothetical protein